MQRGQALSTHIDAALLQQVEERLRGLTTEREVADAEAALEGLLQSAAGAADVAPLRAALVRAEQAGTKGLLVRRAEAKLKELLPLEEAAKREEEVRSV